jgi:hypothetical protein
MTGPPNARGVCPPGPSPARNGDTVTHDAHLWIPPPEPFGVEVCAVRIEPTSAHRGVAGQAIRFRMTGDAGLEAPPSRRAMADEKCGLAIMISAAQDTAAAGRETGHLVAGRAEPRRIVAIRARRLPPVRRRRVACQEVRRVIRAGAWAGPMAVETVVPHMTRGTAQRRGVR